jgi:hypothetical protein
MKREQLFNALDWFVPRKIQRLLTYYRPSAVKFALRHRDVLRANKVLYNRHAGERCFVLCNGPSVKQQDIRPLKGEIVFSVSSGYLHPDYGEVRPRYHCVPQLTYAKVTRAHAVQWFGEMDHFLGDAELFLDQQEWGLVQRHGLFAARNLHYVCMGKNYFPKNPRSVPDLTGIIPRVQTVPIMVIQIALYMGFNRIYLLGVDHDWFIRKEYRYSFEPGLLKGLDLGVKDDGTLETTLWDELPAVMKVWSQYRAVKHIAEESGVVICNATFGGALDEFPRVNLADLARG